MGYKEEKQIVRDKLDNIFMCSDEFKRELDLIMSTFNHLTPEQIRKEIKLLKIKLYQDV